MSHKSPNEALLRATLAAAVPLWIEQFRSLSPGELSALAAECGQVVAEKGDVIQFKSKGTAAAFNALAKGVACLAFAPGGVDFLGDHYEADPSGSRDPEVPVGA